MKTLNIILILVISSIQIYGQKYMTQNGTISFYSKTPLENIEAINHQASSVINTSTNEIAFSILMKAFVFEKLLMQEHFNEKYIESNKFPKATFKGTIKEFKASSLNSKSQEYTVSGQLTIHGITKDISTKVNLSISNGIINGKCKFTITPEEYGINIPGAVRDNIAKMVDINVDVAYEKI